MQVKGLKAVALCTRHELLAWIHIALLVGSLMLQKFDDSCRCRFACRLAFHSSTFQISRPDSQSPTTKSRFCPSLFSCDSKNAAVAKIASVRSGCCRSKTDEPCFPPHISPKLNAGRLLFVVTTHVAEGSHGVCYTSWKD